MPRLGPCLALALLAGLPAGIAAAQSVGDATSAALDLVGHPNSDPEHVLGDAGETMIRVRPRGDAGDFANLQWAADNVAPGGTVELAPGTFFLGDGSEAPKRTVVLRQGLRLRGERRGEDWLTVVRGGGEIGCGPTGIESGPFRVVNADDPHPVIFEDLWLREWTAEAVCIEASRGFVFRRCRLSHPVNTTVDGAIRFIHALWTSGAEARGDFIAEDNLVELGGYDGLRADDEQFMGVFFSNHDTVRVVNNTIRGIDEAIEIIGNRVDRTALGEGPPATGPAEVVVTGNRIEVAQQPGERWPSTFGILVAGNRNASAVRIEDNVMTVRGRGFAFGLSGERLRIAGNRVRLEALDGVYPAGVLTIGFGTLVGLPMGASLDDSVFEDNAFEGRVREVGIQFRPVGGDSPNDSHGNRFDLGESLAGLGAPATLVLSEGVHDNTFTGDIDTVVSEAPEGANRYQSR